MTTERLSILAGAAALREFTAPELAAYTGANPKTVRQVLQREQQHRGLFERTGAGRQSRGGRPAVIWRLKDADAIFEEIAEEESRISKLQNSAGRKEQQITSAGSIDRTDVYLTSAEEAVIRSYEVDDRREQEAFARIALNLLHAANPQPEVAEDENSAADWWEHGQDNPQRSSKLALTSLETISRVRIGAALLSLEGSLARARESNSELIWRRAQRVAAFALLSARQAEALPIRAKDLARAAEAISEGSSVLPLNQTLALIKLFVKASIESGNAPPVAVLTTADRSPNDLFPVARSDWRRLSAPNELARTGYVLWVERWAETLLTSSLIPGVVVSHDDSPESNEALSQVMTDPDNLTPGRAIIIASTAEDFQVVAKVVLGGGIYYPVHNTVEGLLPTVNRAVAAAVSSTPLEFAIFQWTMDIPRHMSDVYINALSQNLIGTIGRISVRPSDLEITRKALTALDSAIEAYRHLASEQQTSYSDLVRVLDSVSAQWPDPSGSRDAIAAVDACFRDYRRIIRLRSVLLRKANLNVHLTSEQTIADRHEAQEALVWAYRELQNELERKLPTLTSRERDVALLVADGKSISEISKALAISSSAAKMHVTNILRKLGFKSRDQIATWMADTEGILNKD